MATDGPQVSHPTTVIFLRYKAKTRFARPHIAIMFALLLSLIPVLSEASSAVPQSSAIDDAGFISVALPQSGELLIENRRGSVQIEVWTKDYVAVAAATQAQKGAARKLPVAIERGDNSLSIRVERATLAKPLRVDLKIRVPSSARLKVSTTDGELNINGLPVALNAQTLSGNLQVALPSAPDASITAQSLNGAVTLVEGVGGDSSAGGRTLKGKFQARWGNGGSTVNLFSGRGLITLKPLPVALGPDGGSVTRIKPGAPRITEAQEEGATTRVVQKPQPAETPQEVDEDEVVRVESDLVTLNVSVVDRASGRGLAGLAAGDFKIYEDNAEQRIEHFESADAPFDLLLLLDLSGSTARVTDTIRAAARRFVAATRPQDRIAIITFAGETQVAAQLTSDRAALRESIDHIAAPKGDTRLYDSLASALEYMTRRADPSRRRAVILMSDGLDSTLPNVTGTGSTLSYDEVRSRVQEFDGVVYTIWTNTEYEAFSPDDIQPETFDMAHDRTEELSAAGGGVFYEVEKLEDLAGAYERVVADLGTVYTLSYRPVNKQRDGRWRAIHIRLPRLNDAVARGKRGYFAK